MNVETNGHANIITFLRTYKLQNPLWAKDEALKLLFERIEAQAWAGISYITKLSNPDGIKWSDFAPKEKSEP